MAVDFVGLPEGRICLAQGVTYLALAPKSNASYWPSTRRSARCGATARASRRPTCARAGFRGAEKLGRGVGYRYPHDEGGVARGQRTCPTGLEDARYYEPKASASSRGCARCWPAWRGREAEEPTEPEEPAGAADGP